MNLPKPYYEDDFVTLYHGDCLELLPGIIGGGSEMVCVTDPPYGIGWFKNESKPAGSRAHAGIVNDESTATRDAALALLPEMRGVVFGSFYAPFPENLKQVLVWPKPADAGVWGSTTGYRRDCEPVFLVGPWPKRTIEWSSLLPVGAGSIAHTASLTGHPHTKPLPLLRHLIERTEGIVIDPFAGSGSTLVAAKDLQRKAVGIEIDEAYCEVAANRCAQEVMNFGSAA